MGAFIREAISHGCRMCARTSCAFIMESWPRGFLNPVGALAGPYSLPDGTTSILRNERFDDLQAAMSRAEEILDGTSAGGYLHRLNPGFAETFVN